MTDKLLPCPFAIEASKKIVTSLRRNTFFASAWEQIDKGIGKEHFESLFADIIVAAWNRRAEPVAGFPATENAPLALDELRGMDDPVWIPLPDGEGYWCLCQKGWITPPSCMPFMAKDRPDWDFYRRKPEGV